MGYNRHYTIETRSGKGVTYSVWIDTLDYAGAVQELQLAGEGVVVKRSKRELFAPMLSMGVEVSVWCLTNYEFVELFTSPSRTHRMTVRWDGVVIFVGYLEASLYEEAYRTPPYTVTLAASDGLAQLADYGVDVRNEWVYMSLWHVVWNSLAATGLGLDVMVDSRFWQSLTYRLDVLDTELDSLLEDGVLPTAHRLLEDVLTAFGLRVYQARGRWWVESIGSRWVDSVMSWRKYTGSADNNPTVETTGDFYTLDTAELMFVGRSAVLRIDPGYGLMEVKYGGDRYDNFLFDRKLIPLGIYGETDADERGLDRCWYRQNYIVDTKSERDEARGFDWLWLEPTMAVTDRHYVYQRTEMMALRSGRLLFSVNLRLKFGSKRESGWYRWRMRISLADSRYVKFNSYEKNGVQAELSDVAAFYTVTKEWPKDFGATPSVEHEVVFSERIECELGGLITEASGAIKVELYPAEWGRTKDDYRQTPDYVSRTGYGGMELTYRDMAKDADRVSEAVVNKDYRRKSQGVSLRWRSGVTLPRILTMNNWKNSLFSRGQANRLGVQQRSVVGDLCILEDGRRLTIEERLLWERMGQYYDARETVTGDVYGVRHLDPVGVYGLATRGGHRYLLHGVDHRLGDDLCAVQLEEVKRNEVVVRG